jgi:hypothetical protein
MENVGTTITDAGFGAIVAAPLAHSWVSEIATCEQVEARLWADYEAYFAQHHEQSLAYRYLPADETETALVQKYFPDHVLDLQPKGVLIVTYAGVLWIDDYFIEWANVSDLQCEHSMGDDTFSMILYEGANGGPGKRKLKVPGGLAQRDAVLATLAQYWHRHKVAHSAG